MQSPATVYRKGATSTVSCLDVAALVAASLLRKNPSAEVIPFSDDIVEARLNPRDSVMTNAKILAALPSGGTNCSAPLKELNRRKAKGDVLIYVSDNESWIDTPFYGRFGGRSTETMKQWSEFKSRNGDAKLVCIDIQPYGHTQAQERHDILNVGGFSDQVFTLVSEFANGNLRDGHWIGVIEKVEV
jgi:60 kDa SS-A/Ro ribonucleoprotein